MQRSTLRRLLVSLRDAGGWLLRSKIRLSVLHSHNIPASKLDACLSQEYPHGLRYLVTEEQIKGRNKPVRRWALTVAGRDFLAALEADPLAVQTLLPVISKWARVHIVETARGRAFRREQTNKRLRKAKRAEKMRFRGRPRASEVYDEPLQGHPRDRNWKSLSNLERIRILRTRCEKNRR